MEQLHKSGALMDLTITLTGTTALIMHNGQLVDPLNPVNQAKKRITSKPARNKTEDDEWQLRQLEFVGALYLDPDVGPYVPGENIARCFRDAATLTRNGKDIVRGLFVTTNVNPLSYDGPRTADGLWDDENFRSIAPVRMQQNRIIRTRPQFRSWTTQADAILDTNVLDFEAFRRIADTAGQLIGIGDWRPRYGRFTATVEAA
jgi:hypothetical protein